MEFLRTWMLSVTSAALAGMLVYVLAPKGSTKKAVRMVAAVFFLTAFFLPFGKIAANDYIFPNLAFNESSQEIPPKLEALLENQVIQAQQSVISQTVNSEFTRRNLPEPETIEFITDILPDKRIAITGVRIQCAERVISADALRTALGKKILEATGIEIQVELL